jgi:hypothetical protein
MFGRARGNRAPRLIIALQLDFATWAWLISVGAVGAKLVAFALVAAGSATT